MKRMQSLTKKAGSLTTLTTGKTSKPQKIKNHEQFALVTYEEIVGADE